MSANEVQIYKNNIQVKFEDIVYPEEIEVYETKNSGTLKRIEILQPDNEWFSLWETDTLRTIPHPFLFIPEFHVSDQHLHNVLQTNRNDSR